MHVKRWLLAVVMLAGLVGLLVPIPASRAQDTVPRFEPSDCPFDIPAGMVAECGYVVVPADHAALDGPTLRLAVATFKSQSANPLPDPVMLLSGGPGEKTVATAYAAALVFASLYPDRDFITFDQRGVGLSEPALDCPEWSAAMLDDLDEADPHVAAVAQYNALMACRDRLAEAGVDFSVYNTTQNAADVSDVAHALGYDQVNLLGVSYGSMLAQVTMRDYPDIIRSVVIDSVLPLQESIFVDTATTATDSLMRLIDACAADNGCNMAYPNLKVVLFDVIDRLNTDPVPVTLTDPLSGQEYPALLTGDAVLDNLAFYLYRAQVLPVLPQAIYDVYNGNYDTMTALMSQTLASYDALSRGMEFSVLCTDDLIGRTPEDYLTTLNALPPQLRGRTDPEDTIEYGAFGICANWPVTEADPSVKEPVVSSIPTLVLGGEFDPVTPPEYGRLVAEHLSHSTVFELPAMGHSVNASSPCAQSITRSFFNDPAAPPDASCIDAMPPVQFAVPGATIALVPFESSTFGISGVIPDGWSELSPGVFGQSMTSQTVLLQQAAPGPQDSLLNLLGTQLGLTETPASEGTRDANGLTWTLYAFEVQGSASRVALAEQNGMTYLIMLICPPYEVDNYTANVFLPAIDALQITR